MDSKLSFFFNYIPVKNTKKFRAGKNWRSSVYTFTLSIKNYKRNIALTKKQHCMEL